MMTILQSNLRICGTLAHYKLFCSCPKPLYFHILARTLDGPWYIHVAKFATYDYHSVLDSYDIYMVIILFLYGNVYLKTNDNYHIINMCKMKYNIWLSIWHSFHTCMIIMCSTSCCVYYMSVKRQMYHKYDLNN